MGQAVSSFHAFEKSVLFEIIFGDNASSDGRFEYFRGRLSDARIIANRENAGFARATRANPAAHAPITLLFSSDTT